MHPCELAEMNALEDAFAAVTPELRERAGMHSTKIGGALCVAVGATSGSTLLNRAVGLDDGSSDDELDAIAAFFAGLRIRYAIQPLPEAPGLAERLLARGFERGYAWMKFERDVAPAPHVETDLRIAHLARDRGADFGQVFARGYGVPDFAADWTALLAPRPGWRLFAAFAQDTIVATGALHVAGPLGWIGFGATLPEHRGRGAQGALLAARIAAASALGCERVVTETGERVPDRPSASYRNILRAGFDEAYLRPTFVAPDTGA